MKKIYVIQVRRSGSRKDHELYREHRNIGWFDSFGKAEECLFANPAIFSDDGYYKVALIESVMEGPYGACMSDDYLVKWYKLEGNTDMMSFDAKYVEAQEFFQDGVIGYTIG